MAISERGFANYDATFRGYVERNQRLVDDDEGFDGAPLARDDFYRVVHSIELTDYLAGNLPGGRR